jgi:hypothetical protein
MNKKDFDLTSLVCSRTIVRIVLVGALVIIEINLPYTTSKLGMVSDIVRHEYICCGITVLVYRKHTSDSMNTSKREQL